VQWYSTEFGSAGESIEITLGEQSPNLFPCSGFVRGNLEGTIKAPALHLKMMGKDIWDDLSLRPFSENDPGSSGPNNKHYGNRCQDIHFQVSGTARMG